MFQTMLMDEIQKGNEVNLKDEQVADQMMAELEGLKQEKPVYDSKSKEQKDRYRNYNHFSTIFDRLL